MRCTRVVDVEGSRVRERVKVGHGTKRLSEEGTERGGTKGSESSSGGGGDLWVLYRLRGEDTREETLGCRSRVT